jgi:hypothetical protein
MSRRRLHALTLWCLQYEWIREHQSALCLSRVSLTGWRLFWFLVWFWFRGVNEGAPSAASGVRRLSLLCVAAARGLSDAANTLT